MLSRPLSEQDQKPGYIYAFKREDNGYFKVGVANNVPRRMKDKVSRCRFEPKVVLEVAVPISFLVERLIKAHLRKERFRESLVNGGCNSGKGCPTTHGEWFKIKLERLRKVVAVWKRFAESEPYDERHQLKPWWQQQLKAIELSSNIDPRLSWIECALDCNSVMAVQRGAREKSTRVKAEGGVGI
jgi:hypothetical protein